MLAEFTSQEYLWQPVTEHSENTSQQTEWVNKWFHIYLKGWYTAMEDGKLFIYPTTCENHRMFMMEEKYLTKINMHQNISVLWSYSILKNELLMIQSNEEFAWSSEHLCQVMRTLTSFMKILVIYSDYSDYSDYAVHLRCMHLSICKLYLSRKLI